MKKNLFKVLTTLVLTLVTAFVLVACNNTEDGDVHVFIYEYADTYIGGVRAELDTQLKEAGITAQFHDGASSQDTQNTQIDGAISAGASLLIVNIVEVGS